MKKVLIATLAAASFACSDDGPNGEDPPVMKPLANMYQPGALFSVWGSGPNDVWVVGGEEGKPVVLRFDGTAWRRDDPPVQQQLWWVHGFPGGPVYVVGDGGAIARWQNGSWEAIDSGFPKTTFFGVWGASPDDIWVVGGKYNLATDPVGDVILRYSGGAWSRVEHPVLDARPQGSAKNLFKVWGANARDVFIVGSNGLALHYDGSTWSQQTTPVTTDLFTVYGRSATDVYAVGFGPSVLQWNGTAWSELETPPGAPTVLQGVWTAPSQRLWVSGHDGFVACRDDAGAWLSAAPITPDAFHGVWGDGAGAVYAAGGNIVAFSPDYRGVLAVTGRDVPAVQ